MRKKDTSSKLDSFDDQNDGSDSGIGLFTLPIQQPAELERTVLTAFISI